MSTGGGWRLEFARQAVKDLKRLDQKTRVRIGTAIDGLAADQPRGDIKRLVGVEPVEYRLRVGEWRVRYRRDAVIRVIAIQRVLPRGRAYRN